jgi:hypothetical protein
MSENQLMIVLGQIDANGLSIASPAAGKVAWASGKHS